MVLIISSAFSLKSSFWISFVFWTEILIEVLKIIKESVKNEVKISQFIFKDIKFIKKF